MNSLLCFTIIVSYIVFSLQHINAKLSTFLINPLVYSTYMDVIHTISVVLTNTTIILITKMFIKIIVCFVTNITSCCNIRHSITYIHKLCQSYGEFKQTSPSYDTVKHNVVDPTSSIDDFVWFSHWPCLHCFRESVNVCGCPGYRGRRVDGTRR